METIGTTPPAGTYCGGRQQTFSGHTTIFFRAIGLGAVVGYVHPLFIYFDSLANFESTTELGGIAIDLEEAGTGFFGVGYLGNGGLEGRVGRVDRIIASIRGTCEACC